MSMLSGGDFFGLDISTNAVKVVQLAKTSSGWDLKAHAYVPVDQQVTAAKSSDIRRKLGNSIATAIGQAGIKTKNVVISLPSQKTFTTIVDLPAMSASELSSTMKYQADQFIPMGIEDAKVDWAILGASPTDPAKQEVLIASTAKEYAEEQLDFIESLGLNVVGIEPNALAMTRAIAPRDTIEPMLMLDVGDLSSDVSLVYQSTPRLIRTIPTGLQTLVKSAAQNLNVQEDQARQFILKFGLATDRLDGQVYRALEGTLDVFLSELTKSVKFFETRYAGQSVREVLLSGYAASVPQFADHTGTKLNIPTEVASPWRYVRLTQDAEQKLAPVSTEFAVAVGLAQRENNL